VTPPPDLSKLSSAGKDALILALMAQLAAAQQRIAALEAQVAALTQPPKGPGNSPPTPSKGQKEDRPTPDGKRPPRKSRPGVDRALHPNPDRVVEARLTACPRCQAALPEGSQTAQQIYDRIELPPV